ncbi:uncharacterized protein LOC127481685 [Manacus candei]|uniref:uncharacterized protein LOC127481685 n=1 Tax=Manacus candei TaxID=415023 RepID=UPI002227D2B6|nr:uncharacterized protein LOC127481685 [Manacus candei]
MRHSPAGPAAGESLAGNTRGGRLRGSRRAPPASRQRQGWRCPRQPRPPAATTCYRMPPPPGRRPTLGSRRPAAPHSRPARRPGPCTARRGGGSAHRHIRVPALSARMSGRPAAAGHGAAVPPLPLPPPPLLPGALRSALSVCVSEPAGPDEKHPCAAGLTPRRPPRAREGARRPRSRAAPAPPSPAGARLPPAGRAARR